MNRKNINRKQYETKTNWTEQHNINGLEKEKPSNGNGKIENYELKRKWRQMTKNNDC